MKKHPLLSEPIGAVASQTGACAPSAGVFVPRLLDMRVATHPGQTAATKRCFAWAGSSLVIQELASAFDTLYVDLLPPVKPTKKENTQKQICKGSPRPTLFFVRPVSEKVLSQTLERCVSYLTAEINSSASFVSASSEPGLRKMPTISGENPS